MTALSILELSVSPRTRTPEARSTTRAISRRMRSNGAIVACGWRSITICRARNVHKALARKKPKGGRLSLRDQSD